MGYLDIGEFLNKYNFTHLLVSQYDALYNNLENSNYFILYENTATGYRLYARNDLFTEKERKRIIDDYNRVVEEAKKQAEEQAKAQQQKVN